MNLKKVKKYPLTLLFAEDEMVARENAVEFLSDMFETIYPAADGLEALQLYREKRPDILITDIRIPKLDGLQLCRTIRKENKRLPIIVTTAYINEAYLLEAIELRLLKYLTKPVAPQKLLDAVASCVDDLNETVTISPTYRFDMLNRSLFCDSALIKLTSAEERLLYLLCRHKERVVTYDEIAHFVWGERFMSDDALKAVVRTLRAKIGKERIQNHTRIGYRLLADA